MKLYHIRIFSLLLAWLISTGCEKSPTKNNVDDTLGPARDYQIIAQFQPSRLLEPSGIVFHPARGTLFAVGDQGDLVEMSLSGQTLYHKNIRHADLEAITCDPNSGLLYAFVEAAGTILEISPGTLTVQREFRVDWSLNGELVLDPAMEAIESITFVPNADTTAMRFYIGNKSTKNNKASPSAIFELSIPLPANSGAPAAILRRLQPGIVDITDLYFEPGRQTLFVISDSQNLAYEITTAGRELTRYRLPGDKQEGMTIAGENAIFIADDAGPIFHVVYP